MTHETHQGLPTRTEAASQLSARRYAVTAPSQQEHDRLAAAAPWATWAARIESRPGAVCWRVIVFDVDRAEFMALMATPGVAALELGIPAGNGNG